MGINSLLLIMPWEGSAQIIILPVPRAGSSFSPCVHPDSTWPLDAVARERLDRQPSRKMDELESRERKSSDGGGGRSNSRGMREVH